MDNDNTNIYYITTLNKKNSRSFEDKDDVSIYNNALQQSISRKTHDNIEIYRINKDMSGINGTFTHVFLFLLNDETLNTSMNIRYDK